MDPKRKANISFALWVPFIWYAFAVSQSPSHWLNQFGDSIRASYLGGNPVERTVYSIFIAIGILILLRRKVDWSHLLRNNTWIFVLFLYMAISILWSDFRGVSFKRWIKTAGALVMVLIVLSESKPFEAMTTLLRRCFYLYLPLSIISIKYFPAIGVTKDGLSEMWKGLTLHKNTLGQVVMVSGIYFLWNIMRAGKRKKIYIDLSYLLMALWLLTGSRSVTSIFGFLFGVCILFMLHFMKSNPKYMGRHIIIGIFFIAFSFLIFELAVESFAQETLLTLALERSGRDMTFTGRIRLWNDIIDIASLHSILGTGYGSFWIGDLTHDLWERHRWRPGQGHNGYIDVYVELGFVGVFLLIAVILSAYRSTMRNFAVNFEYGRFRMVLLSIILLCNITESNFLNGTNNLCFLFLLAAVNISDISHSHHKNIEDKHKT